MDVLEMLAEDMNHITVISEGTIVSIKPDDIDVVQCDDLIKLTISGKLENVYPRPRNSSG